MVAPAAPLVGGPAPAVDVPMGSVSLDVAAYQPLVDALDRDVLTVRDIQAAHPERSLSACVGAFCLLMSGGYGSPVVPGWERSGARERARVMNRLLVHENAHGGDHRCLIAPAIGGAIVSEYVEMVTLGALWDGMPRDVGVLANHVLEVLARQRRLVREDGELVEEQAAARGIVERRVAGALAKAEGLLTRLGVC